MRQHRLIFCREHYLEWFINQTQEIIDHNHFFSKSALILVAVSGGKDSLSLWHVLNALGYNVQGVHINLGIDADTSYSDKSEQAAREFANKLNLSLKVINLASTIGHTIPDLARLNKRPQSRTCSVCGTVKRHTLNQAALKTQVEVLVTGHNLDDEAALLFGNVLGWDVDLLRRQSPLLLEQAGFVRKAKPFFRFTEREITADAILNQIDYIEDECPYSLNAKQLKYKAILNNLEEEQPGAKLRFYSTFQNALKNGLFIEPEEKNPVSDHRCTNCGQPTTSDNLCANCRLLSRANFNSMSA